MATFPILEINTAFKEEASSLLHFCFFASLTSSIITSQWHRKTIQTLEKKGQFYYRSHSKKKLSQNHPKMMKIRQNTEGVGLCMCIFRMASCVCQGAVLCWVVWWLYPDSLQSGSAETAVSLSHLHLFCQTQYCQSLSTWRRWEKRGY